MVKDLRKRLIPALVAAALAMWLITMPAGFALIMVIATVGCAYEMQKISSAIDIRYNQAYRWTAILLSAYTIYNILYHCFPEFVVNRALSEVPRSAFIIYSLLLLTLRFKSAGRQLLPFINLIYPFLGILCLVEVAFINGSYENQYLLFMLVCVWAADMSAYFFGNIFKGPKLAPAISPNKTISGWLGGLFGIAIVTLVASFYFFKFSWSFALLWIPIIWLASSLGDLFESLLKREAGIKDSGVFLPGHGGFLDRLDSLIYVAPFAFYLLDKL